MLDIIYIFVVKLILRAHGQRKLGKSSSYITLVHVTSFSVSQFRLDLPRRRPTAHSHREGWREDWTSRFDPADNEEESPLSFGKG